jgi:hypothetical protein
MVDGTCHSCCQACSRCQWTDTGTIFNAIMRMTLCVLQCLHAGLCRGFASLIAYY